MQTGFKGAHRRIINLVHTVVEHGALVEVFAVYPLQRNRFGWPVSCGAEVMATLNLELETCPNVTSGMDQNANLWIAVRTNPICPVILEGGAVVNKELNEECTGGSFEIDRRRFRL